jgi:hypothetical protein
MTLAVGEKSNCRCLWPVTDIFRLKTHWPAAQLSCGCKLILLYFVMFCIVKELGIPINLTFGLPQTEQLTNGKLWKVTETCFWQDLHIFSMRLGCQNQSCSCQLRTVLIPSIFVEFSLSLSPPPTHTHTHTHTHTNICIQQQNMVNRQIMLVYSIPWCVSKVLPWLISYSIINRLFQNPYTWPRWVSHLDEYIGHMELLKSKLHISVSIYEL